MLAVSGDSDSRGSAELLDILAQTDPQSSFYEHAAALLDKKLAPHWSPSAVPLQPLTVRARATDAANPFSFFEAIYCINLDRQQDRWKDASKRFRTVGIAHRVRRFAAVETPFSHHIGCALSHRTILAEARAQGLRNVLVFEDDVLFSPNAIAELRANVDELTGRSWSLLYLGGHRWGRTFDKAPGCQHLEEGNRLTCTHAIAYHESIFERILADIPATPSAVALWLREHAGIDQYYAHSLGGTHLLTSPPIASQASILSQENRAFRIEGAVTLRFYLGARARELWRWVKPAARTQR